MHVVHMLILASYITGTNKKSRLSSVKWCNGDIVTSLQNLCATEINMNSLRFQLALEGFSILW